MPEIAFLYKCLQVYLIFISRCKWKTLFKILISTTKQLSHIYTIKTPVYDEQRDPVKAPNKEIILPMQNQANIV